MSYLTVQYPSLLGGVSKQAEHNRLPGLAHAQENATNFPAEGLGKRPPTEFMGLIADNSTNQFQIITDGYKPHIAYIDYAPTEKFLLALNRGASPTYSPTATVNSYDGKSYPVSFLGGCETYLQGLADTANGIKTATVQNTTIILNTSAVVGAVITSSAALGERFMLFCKQGAYKSKYTVRMVLNDGADRVKVASVDTWNGTLAVAGELSSIKTNEILGAVGTANCLLNNIALSLAAAPVISTVAGAPPWLEIIHESTQSVATFVCHNGLTIKEITVTDSLGDSGLLGIWKSVPSLASLPVIADDLFKVKVSGGTAENEDDYWVEFQKDASVASASGYPQKGAWYETIAPSTPAVLDNTTLPLKMVPVRNGSGVIQSFEISRITWNNRLVGDTTSNPDPSFVGSTISSVTFWRDRFIFASGYAIIASGSGDYYNFFRTTVRAVPDSDPLDIEISYSKDFIIRWLVGFEDSLFILSDKVIHQLTADPIFSAQYISASPLFEYNLYPYCQPIVVGKTCIFAVDNGSYLHFRELYRVSDESFDTSLITAQVPDYIPKAPCTIAGNASIEMLVVCNGGDAYTYKYAWNGGEKTQSSWGKWTSTESAWDAVGFFDNFLYIYSRPDFHTGATYTALLERITLGDGVIESGFYYNLHLDRRLGNSTFSMVLNGGGNTEISIHNYPFYGTGGTSIQVWEYGNLGISSQSTILSVAAYAPGTATTPSAGGTYISCLATTGTKITVSGNITPRTIKIGWTYRFLEQLGEVQLMEASRGGNGVKPILGGRCQLRYGIFHVNKGKYFKLNLNSSTTATSPTTDYDFYYPAEAPQAVIDQGSGIATDGTYTGPVRVALFKHNQKVRVSLINDSIYPCFFTGVEWELFLNVRGGRYPM